MSTLLVCCAQDAGLVSLTSQLSPQLIIISTFQYQYFSTVFLSSFNAIYL